MNIKFISFLFLVFGATGASVWAQVQTSSRTPEETAHRLNASIAHDDFPGFRSLLTGAALNQYGTEDQFLDLQDLLKSVGSLEVDPFVREYFSEQIAGGSKRTWEAYSARGIGIEALLRVECKEFFRRALHPSRWVSLRRECKVTDFNFNSAWPTF